MKKAVTLLVILLVVLAGIFIWWMRGVSPVNPLDKTQKIFVVNPHQNVRDIAYNLKKEGFIKDPIVFFLTVKQLGLDGKIQAGDFRLSPSMTSQQIALALTHGTVDVWVTIIPGMRSEEIAELLQKNIPTYKMSWKDSLATQEGYLFPDSYLVPTNADINIVMRQISNAFDLNYQKASENKTTKLTKEQAVILASILQREGKSKEDMKMIASVLENRLSIGMALQVDATVQYALGYQPAAKTWWKKDLTIDDLHLNSPYNTYLNAGLPPAPISNPGEGALEAVLHPANTDYLYYVSDKQGNLHFAKTLQEHNANVAKYTQ